MLPFWTTVLFLWFITLVSFSDANKVSTPEETTENPISVKTAFARHAMEIQDLLHMFITLIKKADEEEGRELGLPEITTVPMNLETASLEELFDRFETAAQSFRTRFLKYLKSTENYNSNVAPTLSTGTELNEEKDSSNYANENVEIFSDSEPKIEYSTSTINTDEGSSFVEEKTTLAYIMPNAEISDEMKADSGYLAEVIDDDRSYRSTENPMAFIVTDEVANTDYGASTLITHESDGDSSRYETSIAYILSNMGEQDKESSTIFQNNRGKGMFVTVTPNPQEDSKVFVEDISIESLNFQTPDREIAPEIALSGESAATLNPKTLIIPDSEESINGEAALILDSITEEISRTSNSQNDDSTEVDAAQFTSTEDPSEEYTILSFSTTEHDSDEETTNIFSTTDYSSDETNSVAIEVSDEETGSDEDSNEDLSITEDSDEDGKNFTTTDDSDEETSEIFLTTSESDYTNGVFLATERPEKESSDLGSTTKNYLSKMSRTNKMTDLVRILQEAEEKNDTEESVKKTKYEDILQRVAKSLTENFPQNAKRIKGMKPSNEYTIDKSRDEQISSKSSHLKVNFEALDSAEDFSDRWGVMHENDRPIYSNLDVIGAPGENYPNYTNIPATSFTCEGKISPGLYADLETRCQVFHLCWPNRKESYLCPVGSTFHQQILSCDYWFNSTCSLSSEHYDSNLRLKNYPLDIDNEFDEYFDRDIFPFNFPFDYSHPIFREMKFIPFRYEVKDYSVRGRGIESGKELDNNGVVKIEYDLTSTVPTLEDLQQQETTTDMIDSVKDGFRDLLRSFVEPENSKFADFSDDEKRKYVQEKMSKSKLERSGILPEETTEENSEAESTSPGNENIEVSDKDAKSKSGKEKISPAIVFKALETAENIVTKGILPITRDMLAANYIKLYKKKIM